MSGNDHTSGMHPKVKRRLGASIEEGKAHQLAHRNFGRRDFLRLTGLAALGSSLMLGSTSLRAFAPNPLLQYLNLSDCGDRVLVLIRLKGGNDGLNTVILRGNDEYYNIRPTIAVQESGLWALSDQYGMPNEMNALQPLWESGSMKVIHNVGYPDANYSHFRSSDIWASASDSEEIVNTGWIGRWLENDYQAFASAPPVVPPALQIGVETNMIFRALSGNMALSISNPQEFYQIALSGQLYSLNNLGSAPPDRELAYVRTVANSAFRYSESIRDAYNNSITQASYSNSNFGEELAIVARLIKGNLGSKVYLVTIDGFDTHANQLTNHPVLLQRVADSVAAFYQDLAASGHSQNVLAMTFSEFGRTIYENASVGTDHGTSSPMLVFGEGIGNGFIGQEPDLVNTDNYGDPIYTTDFRDAYATVLENWLCVHPDVVNSALGNDFSPLGGLLPPSSPPAPLNDPVALLGHNPDPEEPGVIQIKYSLQKRGPLRLSILLPNGSSLRTLVDTFHERGSYIYRLRPQDFYLAPGQYVYRLENGGRIYQREISL
jgi:uncharacterized protein (DUF1501 family)